MISLPANFLARSSDDSMIKLIFGAIVMIFWIGGALISAINKRIEENKRRARYGQMPAGYTVPPAQPPAATARAAGFPTPPAKAKSAKRGKPAPKRQQMPAARPQPQARPTFTTLAAPVQSAPVAPVRQQQASAPPSQIGRLLRRPESLRAALILNEILSPPLSVRDSVKDGRRVE
jgi:hypothetical protein